MFRLHYNSGTDFFTVRRADRSIVGSHTRLHSQPRFLGHAIALSPSVHILLTPSEFKQAKAGKRPICETTVTSWPKVRLLIKRIKEMTK